MNDTILFEEGDESANNVTEFPPDWNETTSPWPFTEDDILEADQDETIRD
jgi:hypothetical protein